MNIVKDDLIVKVDELTGEVEILREELNAVSQSRNKLRQKITDLEDELKKTKEQTKQQCKCAGQYSKTKNYCVHFTANSDQEDEGDVPISQRKRFTRVEMARVLMERNQVIFVVIYAKLAPLQIMYFSTKNVSWNFKRQCDGPK